MPLALLRKSSTYLSCLLALFLLLSINLYATDNNFKIEKLQVPVYTATNTVEIEGDFINQSDMIVEHFTVAYSTRDEFIHTHSFSGLDIFPGETHQFRFKAKLQMNKTKQYPLDTQLVKVNHEHIEQQKIKKTIAKTSRAVDRTVLLEVFTDTEHGDSPVGQILAQDVLAQRDNVILANLHWVNNLYGTAEATDLLFKLGSTSPSLGINRTFFNKPAAVNAFPDFPWNTFVPSHLPDTNDWLWSDYLEDDDNFSGDAAFEIDFDATFNVSNRELTVNATATALSTLSGEYRINCYIVEKNIQSPSGVDELDQTNYYNEFPTTYPHSELNGLGVQIDNYNHQNVVLAMLGGAWGKANSISSPVTNGSAHETNFSYTVPTSADENNLMAIVLVQGYSQDFFDNFDDQNHNSSYNVMQIEQALSKDVGEGTGFSTLSSFEYVQLSPNPAQNFVRLNYHSQSSKPIHIRITDLQGRIVNELNIEASMNNVGINTSSLASGLYIVEMFNDKEYFKSKLEIIR